MIIIVVYRINIILFIILLDSVDYNDAQPELHVSCRGFFRPLSHGSSGSAHVYANQDKQTLLDIYIHRDIVSLRYWLVETVIWWTETQWERDTQILPGTHCHLTHRFTVRETVQERHCLRLLSPGLYAG